MKLFSITTFCFAFAFALSAGEFEDAEKLFQQGKFAECDSAVGKLLKSKLPDAQKQQLQAMREYILGNNPAKIAETVKQAQSLAAHRGWLTADLLNHSTLLIRRAEDWKSRGIPEYQDLSATAAKLLAQIKDGGNPEIAIKQLLLQTKNFNLNGEYQEPIPLIRQALRHYYPYDRRRRTPRTAGEIQLLILLGEQYAGIGIRANTAPEKSKAISAAAQYYLLAAENLPADSAELQDLSNRLQHCRETLRLLGFQLRLPKNIKPQQSVAIAMIDEMLRTRRYHDVILALEQNRAPAMRLRYAAALAAIGQSEKAAQCVADLEIAEPHFLLGMARNAANAGKPDAVATFLQLFLKLVPDGADTLTAAREYAALLVGQQKFDAAATAFLRLADLSKDVGAKDAARYQAAQCLYQSGQYRLCIALFDQMSADAPQRLLTAQAKIKINDLRGALDELNRILATPKLPEDTRRDAIRLAIPCARAQDDKRAVELLELALKIDPQAPEAPEYAKILLQLYQSKKAPARQFAELAAGSFARHPGHRDTVPLILQCAENIPDARERERVLRLLLQRADYSAAELNVLLKRLPGLPLKQAFLRRYPKPFSNHADVCELFLQKAELAMAMKNESEALKAVELLLAQPEVFRYKECKLIQARANENLKRGKEARKAFQELLLTPLTPLEKREIVWALARSWEREQDYKKAIATAWTAIPLNGAAGEAREDQMQIKALLELILRNAERIDSRPDINDAKDFLKAL